MILTPRQAVQVAKIQLIIAETAAKHGVSPKVLIDRNRLAGVAWARFEVMRRARHEAGASYALIGHVLGGRNHSTIMNGIKRYADR